MQKNKNNYLYTVYFCEENIWHLGKSLIEENFLPEKMFVFLLTNPRKQIPLWGQKKAKKGEAIIWDYHVILGLYHNQELWVFDFDSILPFPSPIFLYSYYTFRHNNWLPSQYHIYFRTVPLQKFHEYFHSDRKHMLNDQGVPYVSFPPWEPIINPGKNKQTLANYLNIKNTTPELGHLLTYNEYKKWLSAFNLNGKKWTENLFH